MVFSIIRAFWYPGAYYAISGVSKQVWVLVAVVFVVGPVLSTFVYRPGKKGLAMDLRILAGIELAALTVVAALLYLRQPYFTVFAIDRFEAVSRQGVVDFDAATAKFGTRPGHQPRLIFASLPEDPDRMQALIDETVLMGMADIDRRPEFWAPYASGIAAVKQAARPLADLMGADEERAKAVGAWLTSSGRSAGAFLYVPLRGKAADAVIVLDAAIGFPVGTIAVDPWLSTPQDGQPARDIEQTH
ncbi:MAG: hypothetical protein GTO71_02270 [Woeseiaceae bacterium]|nr:hypothetical protein [Woeseiaceae bacterium]NIP19936.1 hypothetical protein [Woeseiaceae bacterium]